MVRLKALERNGILRLPSQVFRLDVPGRGKFGRLLVVLPVDSRGANDCRCVGSETGEVGARREESDHDVGASVLPHAVMVVANLEDIAARGFLDDFAWTVLRSHRDLDAGILDPRERGTVDERGAHALRAVAQDHLDVPVVPAFHERRIRIERALRANDDGAALLNLGAVVDPVRRERDAHA